MAWQRNKRLLATPGWPTNRLYVVSSEQSQDEVATGIVFRPGAACHQRN